ncbi:type II secretion system protein [Nostocaceae cyanobacterium CENA369]|uniref:Type II secretion system protein n=1 Tax=Dendronalium phyllosphericum CENA369 TaxID=1725256 RepID=A0A8J7I1Y1_9NOST|nr:type II secretion system protein [Dendronalium phyllosphericum]MBH8574216.1 type II secretion system protein [Dendronalium phyllosphericum CENA369]
MNKLSFKSLYTHDGKKKTQRQCIASHFAVKNVPQEAGFSMIELIVVVVMIGVLAAIATPSWLTFINRQRLNKANDFIITALQEAQRQAQKTKRSYSVSFTTNSNNVAKIAIYPDGSLPDNYWRNLGEDVQIKPGTVLLGTNLSDQNTAGSSVSYAQEYNASTNKQTITFDYMATLPNANFGTPPSNSTDAPGIKIAVAIPSSSSSTSPTSTKRCVIVKTLLGSIVTDKDNKCN